jgi:hypothetical protein
LVAVVTYPVPVGADELWIESYQGEVLGEALFGSLAEREQDPGRRHQLEVLTLLERTTKELAEPVLARRALPPGDAEASRRTAIELADAVVGMAWEDFLGSIPAITDEFLDKYRRLVELASDAVERAVAEAYVAHEEALASFARRALGQEAGEPLQPILALPHVTVALATP